MDAYSKNRPWTGRDFQGWGGVLQSNKQREDEAALPRVVKVCGSDERSSDKTYYKETKDDDIRPQHSKQCNE